ncbi:uncharacterized protein ACIBXB_006841 isoform 1-T1 [Morphnus guianensis]
MLPNYISGIETKQDHLRYKLTGGAGSLLTPRSVFPSTKRKKGRERERAKTVGYFKLHFFLHIFTLLSEINTSAEIMLNHTLTEELKMYLHSLCETRSTARSTGWQ